MQPMLSQTNGSEYRIDRLTQAVELYGPSPTGSMSKKLTITYGKGNPTPCCLGMCRLPVQESGPHSRA